VEQVHTVLLEKKEVGQYADISKLFGYVVFFCFFPNIFFVFN